ncbi:MAG: hypothetical protein D6701_07020, partial [Gemmatimonadetes bacterium]
EHFGYVGREPTADGRVSDHRSFGAAARLLAGRLDLGVGAVRSTFDDPWGEAGPDRLTTTSWFGKAEWLAYPWLIASVKVDRFRRSVDGADVVGMPGGSGETIRAMPGLIVLVRQNVRAVVEGEIFARDTAADALGESRRHGLWVRLDLAF